MDWLAGINLYHSLSGALVGLLIGMTGVGGGSLMTPLLILLFGMAPTTAVGTDLLFASGTKLCGTAVHHKGDRIEWRVVGLLALGSVPGTACTLLAMKILNMDKHSASHIISDVLGVALLITAATMLARPKLMAYARAHVRPISPLSRLLLTVITGGVVGVIVTLSSVGAGALGVTVLMLLYPELPPSRIVGTDVAHAVPLTLISGLGHWWLGSVDWLLLISLLLGSIPGVLLGSHWAGKVPEVVLRLLLAAVLVIAGSRLLF